jgi:ubiquinone/menaquinone biosynthesis C-methylase UbiE
MFSRSAEIYDAIYSFKDYSSEAETITKIIRENNADARTLLDVACGTGTHLQHLSKDFQCEGLDLDDGLLAVARQRLPSVAFHRGDMRDFELGKKFDVVTCLFSSIGYVGDEEGLKSAVRTFSRHLNPGGVLLVEPWFSPDQFHVGRFHIITAETADLKVARANTSRIENGCSVMDFHYLVAAKDGVEHFQECHRLALFTPEQYRHAFEERGLKVDHEEEGLMGRGLYIARFA